MEFKPIAFVLGFLFGFFGAFVFSRIIIPKIKEYRYKKQHDEE